jgi:hypothetical protein
VPKSLAVKRRDSGFAVARFLVRSSTLIAMTFGVSSLAVAQVDPAIARLFDQWQRERNAKPAPA